MRLRNLLLVFLFTFFSSITFSQDYFPLEVGNRWDYIVEHTAFGGFISTSKYSVEVTGSISLPDNKTYYILSNELFDTYYLRIENDSLFGYNLKDSSDCLILSLNLTENNSSESCKYDSVNYGDKSINSTFGITDTCFDIGTKFTFFNFSKKFGLVNAEEYFTLSQDTYTLSGCVISGITYGLLLNTESNANTVKSFELFQNYPNPFNPTTKISYTIPAESHVTLGLYNTPGQLVRVLVDEIQSTGLHSITLNSEGLSNGVYFYQLRSGKFIYTRKLVVMK